jgi:histidyl-tRNA synthetase
VNIIGKAELIERLMSETDLPKSARAKQGLEEMRLLFKYLEIYRVTDKVSFDLSLARGLDYYTGVIYEAVLIGSGQPGDETVGVGSIAGGGRYDELVGMFAQSRNANIPCIGFSIGVERIFSILKHKYAKVRGSFYHSVNNSK